MLSCTKYKECDHVFEECDNDLGAARPSPATRASRALALYPQQHWTRPGSRLGGGSELERGGLGTPEEGLAEDS